MLQRILLILIPGALLLFSQSQPPAAPWRDSEVVEPAALAARLNKGEKPAMYFVGPAVIWRANHIPGSVNTGMASREPGLEALVAAVKHKPKNAEILIYCGCCPWDVCPNMRPAYARLRKEGYTNIKVLKIPTRLSEDWKAKGYPTATGE